jgi:hypothetical protein
MYYTLLEFKMAIVTYNQISKTLTNKIAALFAKNYTIACTTDNSLILYNPANKHYYKIARSDTYKYINTLSESVLCEYVRIYEYNTLYDARQYNNGIEISEQLYYTIKPNVFTDSVDELLKIFNLRKERESLKSGYSSIPIITINHSKLNLIAQFKIMECVHKVRGFKNAKFSDIEKIILTKRKLTGPLHAEITVNYNNNVKCIKLWVARRITTYS